MKKTCGIIIANSEGKILLQHRDNIPGINFPDYWSFFGGHVEEGESIEETIKREAIEEISYELKDFKFWREFKFEDHTEYFFIEDNKEIKLSDLDLKEGAGMGFFDKDEIKRLKCNPFMIPIVEEYFKEFS